MSHTKYRIPQPNSSDLIERTELTRELNDGLRAKLTAITAPGGYGKTTALSVWARQSGCKLGWVSLDRHDNDLTRFWRHVVAAVRCEDPEFGEQLQPDALGQRPYVHFMDELIQALESFRGELALVLDDYHVIERSDIHESLSYPLDYLPRHIHLYIASRSTLPIPAARLTAKGELVSVSMNDLRFGLDDGLRFFRACMGVELTDEEAAMFVRRTEGWISGLHLAAISMRKSGDPAAFIRNFNGTQRGIAQYLLEEVLARQSDEAVRFLLQTSILARMNAPLCEAVTGEGGAQLLLERLTKQLLFITPLDDSGEWYRYHHLFAEFLTQQFRHRMPERWEEAHAAAARWLAANGDPAAAVEHLMIGGHYEGAVGLIELHLAVLQDHRATLMRWLRAMPDAALRTSPFVQLLYLKMKSESGNYVEVHRELKELESVLDSPDWLPWLGAYDFLAAETAMYCRNLPLSYEYLKRYDLHEREGTSHKLQMIAGNTSVGLGFSSLLSFFGSMQDAENHLLTCIRIWENKGNAPFLGYFYGTYSDLLIEWNRIDEAESLLGRMLSTDRWQRYTRIWVFAARLYARCRLIRGEADHAIAAMEEVKERIIPRPGLDLFVQRVEAEIALLAIYAGRTERAEAWLRTCKLRHTDPVPVRYREYFILARALTEAGRTSEACMLMDRIVRLTEQKDWLWDRIKALIQYGIALDRHGSEEEALAKLEEALHLAEPQGFVQSFVGEGRALGPMFVRYLRRRQNGASSPSLPVSLAYVRKLLAMMDASSEEARNVPSLLTAQESRVLHLVDQGYKNREIAERIGVSDETVKKHLKNIYQKLDAANRLQAVNRAKALRLI